MKRAVTFILFVFAAVGFATADIQFRAAGDILLPVRSLPTTSFEWERALTPDDDAFAGWHWEVVFDRVGLGMHYTVRPQEAAAEVADVYLMDWKGDFFFSYHFFGAGSVLDPFLQYGWGNAGTTTVTDGDYGEYPDWEEEVENRNAEALSFYSYVAAGIALDLNGFYFGARLSYIPPTLQRRIPVSGIDPYDLDPFEIGLFAGIALGGRR